MTKKMTRLESGIYNAMVEHGNINPDWRINITHKEIIGKSDWAEVLVEVKEPRKRKPTYIWTLAINIVRDQINWDKSGFVRA